MSSALSQKLISPVKIGPHTLSHRIVMALLTRMRSGPGDVPGDLMVEYYGQRASDGGLIAAPRGPTKLTIPTCKTLLSSVSHGHAPGEYTNFDLLVARASMEGLDAISGEPSSAPLARFDHGASLSIDQPTAPFRA
jgi:hypothetical protein